MEKERIFFSVDCLKSFWKFETPDAQISVKKKIWKRSEREKKVTEASGVILRYLNLNTKIVSFYRFISIRSISFEERMHKSRHIKGMWQKKENCIRLKSLLNQRDYGKKIFFYSFGIWLHYCYLRCGVVINHHHSIKDCSWKILIIKSNECGHTVVVASFGILGHSKTPSV